MKNKEKTVNGYSKRDNNRQNTLKIPVSEIKPIMNGVSVYSGCQHIGNLLAYNTVGIITYDTANSELQKLNWLLVYNTFREEIFSAIVKVTGNYDVLITVGPVRHMYVRNEAGLNTEGYEYRFENNEWSALKIA